MKKWHFFISHASEEKPVAEVIAHGLTQLGYSVWFDKSRISYGDNLQQKIDEGLEHCIYGLFLLSHHFFKKYWTHIELSAFLKRQAEGEKIIVPIYWNITNEEVASFSPELAALFAIDTKEGINDVVLSIAQTFLGGPPVLGVDGGCPNCRKGRLLLDDEGICSDGPWNIFVCSVCGWSCRDIEICRDIDNLAFWYMKHREHCLTHGDYTEHYAQRLDKTNTGN